MLPTSNRISVSGMFTGIVEELGTVQSRQGDRLRIGAAVVLQGSDLGASIAVNGCCLTLVAQGPGWWEADVSEETYSRTNLGAMKPGDPVNLERPMALGERLGPNCWRRCCLVFARPDAQS